MIFFFSLVAQYYVKKFLTTASIIFKAVQKRSTILFSLTMFILFLFLKLRNSGGFWMAVPAGSPTTKVFVGGLPALPSFQGEGLSYSLIVRIETICYKTSYHKDTAQFKISQHNGHVLCDIFYPMQGYFPLL